MMMTRGAMPVARTLKEYKAKRDFASTPEPSGRSSGKRARKPALKSKLLFCVQKHLASHLHYDLRLEHNGVLLSWAVPKGPSVNPKDKRLAMRVEDHPLDYADFEGVIPEGYGAGIVMLWDTGTWTPQVGPERRPGTPRDVDAGLKKGELKFSLEGTKLKGSWVLVRTRGPDSRTWLLIKHRDEGSAAVDITGAAPDSVKSFGDFADILASDDPDVWQSNRPAKSGEAGTMFQKIVARAQQLKRGGGSGSRSAPRRKKPSSRRKKSVR